MKKRKVYERPALQAIELRQRTALLTTSGSLPGMPGYPSGGDPLNGGGSREMEEEINELLNLE